MFYVLHLTNITLFVKLYLLLPVSGNFFAPIVQRIEHQPSKLAMGVRFPLGAHMTIIQIVIFILVLALFVFFVVEFYNIVFKGFAPFIPTRPKVIKKIIEEMEISENAKIMEFGCGGAGFLRAVHKKYPNTELIGIEYSPLPYVVANIQNALGKNNIKIIRGNFFNTDVSNVDLIYCYLSVDSMQDLEKKFRKECKPGTQIISFTFPMRGMEPVKKCGIGNVGEKIFFYKI